MNRVDVLLLARTGATAPMKTFPRLVALVVFCAAPIAALVAQPLSGPPPCWPPPCIPIDGGLGLLVAAGTLIGARQALAARRSDKSEN